MLVYWNIYHYFLLALNPKILWKYCFWMNLIEEKEMTNSFFLQFRGRRGGGRWRWWGGGGWRRDWWRRGHSWGGGDGRGGGHRRGVPGGDRGRRKERGTVLLYCLDDGLTLSLKGDGGGADGLCLFWLLSAVVNLLFGNGGPLLLKICNNCFIGIVLMRGHIFKKMYMYL